MFWSCTREKSWFICKIWRNCGHHSQLQHEGPRCSSWGYEGPFCEESSYSLYMSVKVSAKCSGFPQYQNMHIMVNIQRVSIDQMHWLRSGPRALFPRRGWLKYREFHNTPTSTPLVFLNQEDLSGKVTFHCRSLNCWRPWYRNNTDGPLFGDLIRLRVLHL